MARHLARAGSQRPRSRPPRSAWWPSPAIVAEAIDEPSTGIAQPDPTWGNMIAEGQGGSWRSIRSSSGRRLPLPDGVLPSTSSARSIGEAVTTSAQHGVPLLQADNIRTVFATPRGQLRAVDGVSIHAPALRKLGIVGESGSASRPRAHHHGTAPEGSGSRHQRDGDVLPTATCRR